MVICILLILVIVIVILLALKWDMALSNKRVADYKKINEIFAISEEYLLHLKPISRLKLNHGNKNIKDLLGGRLSNFLMAMLLAALVGVLSSLMGTESLISENNTVLRNTYGQGNKAITITGEIDGNEKEYEIKVSERQLTKEQAEALLEACSLELDKLLLGQNQSYSMINKKLNLVDSLADGLVKVIWHFSDYSLIDSEGRISSKNLRKKIAQGDKDYYPLRVGAVLSYRDYSCEFNKELLLYEPEKGQGDWDRAVNEALEDQDENTLYEEYLKLPDEIEGRRINWYEPSEDYTYVFLILGCVAAIGLCMSKTQEEKKKLQQRVKQLEGDYPEFVSKLNLMLSAGMSFRNAWDRMGEDYKDYKEKNPGYFRFLYEEMVITSREIQGGMPIRMGIDSFCARTKVPCYKKFGSLLLQSMDKGMKGLCQALDYEVMQAFQEKKAKTKILGEEASTKLLLPMGILLFIVLIIVIIPAFMTMGF